jgi:hypothetical protein
MPVMARAGPGVRCLSLCLRRSTLSWPWTLDGTPPAGSEPDLLAASESGSGVGSYAWTGTTAEGLAEGSDCQGWTSSDSSDSGRAGENGLFGSRSSWIDSFDNGCSDTFFALICVSDGPAP